MIFVVFMRYFVSGPSSEHSSPLRKTSSTKVYFIGNEVASPKKPNDVITHASPKTDGAVPHYSMRANGVIAQPAPKANGIIAHASGNNGAVNFDKVTICEIACILMWILKLHIFRRI